MTVYNNIYNIKPLAHNRGYPDLHRAPMALSFTRPQAIRVVNGFVCIETLSLFPLLQLSVPVPSHPPNGKSGSSNSCPTLCPGPSTPRGTFSWPSHSSYLRLSVSWLLLQGSSLAISLGFPKKTSETTPLELRVSPHFPCPL